MILISILNLYLNQICGPENPSLADNCLAHSDWDHTCCFAAVSNYNETSSMVIQNATVCVNIEVNKTFFTPYITQMDLGIANQKLNLSIDCGNYTYENQRAFESCGPKSPVSFQDCQNDTKGNNTCCYIASPDGTSTCLLNTGFISTNTTIYGVKIVCDAKLYSIFFYSLIITIILILL